jgi:DNA-binding MarR family transcriptional regulator
MLDLDFDDPEALRAWRDATLYRRLLRAVRAETTATLQAIHELGYDDVTLSDTNLLANLDTDGSTITALARRAGVTRQAASQQVAALEQAGYVKRYTSEVDARAVRVVQSARGRALLREALEVVAELEASYAAILGKQKLSTLKASLGDLLDEIDPSGVLSPD